MDTMISASPVMLTKNAIEEVKRLMNEETFNQDNLLRIGVKGGGCSGMTYVLGFEPLQNNDEIFEIDEIKCIINPAHTMYLAGMEIEWEGGLNSRGFTFKNPNASKTCGCGTSFAV